MRDPHKPIVFRETCDHCSAWLHCCKNCRFYQRGLPNDCRVPGTDPISDREGVNFCEEFAVNSGRGDSIKISSPEEAAKRLFGDTETHKKKSFEDLF